MCACIFNVNLSLINLVCFLKKRQFTDVSNFMLRCLVCNTLLKGHSDAQNHAKSTGHINFGEV